MSTDYQNKYQNRFYEQDTASIDAFNRLRVSSPLTIFDSKQLYDNSPLFWDDVQLSGGGTSSTHSTATASTTIAVSANTAGARVRQTFMRFNYQPAKSQQIFMTFVMGTSTTGITKRIGYFDENNGIFLQHKDGVMSFVIRSKASGTVVDTVYPQSEWVLDKMDRYGRSGWLLDMNTTQILAIDFEWLGVGRVRFGFVLNGLVVYCHQSTHANVLNNVYMSTPNLPLRVEITNSGVGGASSLKHICASVVSEGGRELTGVVRGQSTGVTPVTFANTANIYPVLGIRLKATHFGVSIDPLFASFLSTTVNDAFNWFLYYQPTISGTFTYVPLDNSAIEYAIGSGTPTITGGTIINTGYGQAQTDLSQPLINALRLGASITGTPTSIVLAVEPTGASLGLNASMNWRELL